MPRAEIEQILAFTPSTEACACIQDRLPRVPFRIIKHDLLGIAASGDEQLVRVATSVLQDLADQRDLQHVSQVTQAAGSVGSAGSAGPAAAAADNGGPTAPAANPAASVGSVGSAGPAAAAADNSGPTAPAANHAASVGSVGSAGPAAAAADNGGPTAPTANHAAARKRRRDDDDDYESLWKQREKTIQALIAEQSKYLDVMVHMIRHQGDEQGRRWYL